MGVNPPQVVNGDISLSTLAFAQQIHDLSTHQALGTNCLAKTRHDIQNLAGVDLVLGCLFGNPLETGTQQGITGQNGQIFPIDDLKYRKEKERCELYAAHSPPIDSTHSPISRIQKIQIPNRILT